MRKILLSAFMAVLLCSFANAGTLTGPYPATIPAEPTAIHATDNTTLFIGTDQGDVWTMTVSDNTTAKQAPKNPGRAPITAIASEGTYNYVGTTFGDIWRRTISGGAWASTPTCSVSGQKITGLKWDATLSVLWVTTNKGKIYKCAP